MEFRAQSRSPVRREGRLVWMIKRRKVEDALNILVFTRALAARGKLLRSRSRMPISEQRKGIDVDVDKLSEGRRGQRRAAHEAHSFRHRWRGVPLRAAYRDIEIVLAERGKSGEGLATVVGEETATASSGPGQAGGKTQTAGGQEESRSQIMDKSSSLRFSGWGYTKPWSRAGL